MQHGADIQKEVTATKFNGGTIKENGLSPPIRPKKLIRHPKKLYQKMGESTQVE
jgi:hypothetical protein